MTTAATTELVELEVTFRAVNAGSSVRERVPELFARAWPAYRNWFLQDGEAARPSYATCAAKLHLHMPEIVDTYEELVEAVGGGDLESRFLSHWCPPPLFGTCSLAVWTRGEHALVHNYDFSPLLCDTILLGSNWHGADVVVMSDCGWGATDGMNSHGLAAAIAFGGRPAVGEGFGIGLVVRYLLEVAHDVPSALEVLARVPVRLAYNVALVDRAGEGAIAHVSPDRPLAVSHSLTAGNRQGATEWPEHAVFSATVEREEALAKAVAEPGMTADGLVERFLSPPIYREPAATPWGTVYTAAYDSERATVRLCWPGESWTLSVGDLQEGSRRRHTLVAVPAGAVEAVSVPSHGHPSFIA